MNILFVLYYPGYLRYFDSTIAELTERGHSLQVAFDAPAKQSEGLEALNALGGRVHYLGGLPRRRGLRGALAVDLRRTTDYARYLHPGFGDAAPLRRRMESALPRIARPLTRVKTLGPRAARLLLRILLALERAVPSSPEVEEWVASVDPDLVLVSPLLTDASPQTEVVKAAQKLGIPSAVAVTSWDHLSTKGLLRVQPDRVLLWNEGQKSEAVELHALPGSKAIVTGAQPFDRWFDRTPSTTRERFCARAGLPSERPFVLFAGSTASISEPLAELAFVRSWIAALRGSDRSELRDLAVLVRPHPFNTRVWEEADLSEFDHVSIWPRSGANPVDAGDRNDYFDSLFHSSAVVGINTSAMIEAAIVGRPVHTIRAPEFAETQGGTLHFRFLLPEGGGFLRVADSLAAHEHLLADTLSHPEEVTAQIQHFLGWFVRPHGLDRPATPILVDAIERVRALGSPGAVRTPAWIFLVRGALWAFGLAVMLTDREQPGSALARARRQYEKAARKAFRRYYKASRRAVRRRRRTLARAPGQALGRIGRRRRD